MGNLASRCIRAPINDRISAELMGRTVSVVVDGGTSYPAEVLNFWCNSRNCPGPVQHKRHDHPPSRFDSKMHGSTQKCPV